MVGLFQSSLVLQLMQGRKEDARSLVKSVCVHVCLCRERLSAIQVVLELDLAGLAPCMVTTSHSEQ